MSPPTHHTPDSAATDSGAVGSVAADVEAAGIGAAGSEVAGVDVTGAEAAGTEVTGREATGGEAAYRVGARPAPCPAAAAVGPTAATAEPVAPTGSGDCAQGVGSAPGSGPASDRAPGRACDLGSDQDAAELRRVPEPVIGTEERLARAALTRVAEPGDELFGRLLAEHGPVGLRDALRAELPLPGVRAGRLRSLAARLATADPEAELAALAERGGRFLCPGDREWPRQLDDLGAGRPVGLWVRGRCSLRFAAVRSVAVVGARACTEYGSHVAVRLAAGLAERGWSVVSGAAFGVDGAAHRGVLSSGGLTIGVLACGVDRAYPPANRELIARIADQGVLVAELPPGSHPTRSRFILRNRVIAALTRGTVVVEAQLRSGSLVTARRAGDLGRAVMGVPGPVTSQLSAGVHRLLREEGELVTSAAEVVELLGDVGELAPRESGPVLPRDLLHPRTRQVLEAMPARTAITVARLAGAAGAAEEDVGARLLELGTLGFVVRQGAYWQLTHPSG